ncbi:carboxylesterase family protein [Rhodoflexus sp.]
MNYVSSLVNTYSLTTLLYMCLIGPILLVLGTQTHAQRFSSCRTADGIGYLEHLPADYQQSNKSYPLLIFLHGITERGNGTTDLRKIAGGAMPFQIERQTLKMTFTVKGETFSFIVLCPQLSYNYGSWPVSYVDRVVEYAKATYRVDESRIYVTGLSLGGGGTWDYAAAYPDKVAAIAPVCGASGANKMKIASLVSNQIPVWAFHGTADNVVPTHVTLGWVRGINEFQGRNADAPKAKVTLYPKVGHNAWKQAYSPNPFVADPVAPNPMTVYEWMLLHSKPAAATSFGYTSITDD